MYEYQARCFNVVDGDTIDVTIDLGFRMRQDKRIRVAIIDTPERGQDGWHEAKAFTTEFCMNVEGHWPLIIHTVKPRDKYGRWLADVQRGVDFLSMALLDAGLAKRYGE
jgi:micrococcal nuclease